MSNRVKFQNRFVNLSTDLVGLHDGAALNFEKCVLVGELPQIASSIITISRCHIIDVSLCCFNTSTVSIISYSRCIGKLTLGGITNDIWCNDIDALELDNAPTTIEESGIQYIHCRSKSKQSVSNQPMLKISHSSIGLLDTDTNTHVTDHTDIAEYQAVRHGFVKLDFTCRDRCHARKF